MADDGRQALLETAAGKARLGAKRPPDLYEAALKAYYDILSLPQYHEREYPRPMLPGIDGEGLDWDGHHQDALDAARMLGDMAEKPDWSGHRAAELEWAAGERRKQADRQKAR